MEIKREKAANILAALLFILLAAFILNAGRSEPPNLARPVILPRTENAQVQETALDSQASFPPQEIGGFHLSEHKSGGGVLAELKEMHGKSEKVEIIKEGHFLGYSSKEGGSMSAWIGKIDSEEGAKMLTALMTQKIRNSSKFSLKEERFGNVAVYNLQGLGFDENYYYSLGNKTVWIGVSNIKNLNASKLIEELNSQIVKF